MVVQSESCIQNATLEDQGCKVAFEEHSGSLSMLPTAL
jgi:hypothetical protein